MKLPVERNWISFSFLTHSSPFAPLGRLVVREVKAIGHALGLPRVLVEKVPSDGLCGKTDEDNLGFTYAALDRYIREGVMEDEATKARIDRLHKLNEFKLKPIPYFPYLCEPAE